MKQKDPYASLRIPNFRFFLFSKILVTIAIQMQAVAVGWHVYELTHDPLSLGMIGLAEAIPAIGIALFAGHMADLYSRKKIVFISFITLCGCALGLSYLSSNADLLAVNYKLFGLYMMVFVTGLARGFLFPSMFGLMSQCVHEDLYPNSSAWNSSLWHMAVVLGAAMGGVLFVQIGKELTYLLSAVFCFFAVLSVAQVVVPPVSPAFQKPAMLDSLLGGLRFVFSQPIFLAAMALDLFAVMFGGAVAILPIFADQILQCGPEGLGWLRAAPPAGAFLMALVLAHYPPLRHTGKILFLSVAGFGLCMILFALSTQFWLSLGILFLSGVFDNVSVVVRSTIMQMLTPHDMKGRVSSVHSIFVGSSNEIGAFESGVAAKYLGTVPSVVFGGVVTLGVVLIGYATSPSLRKLHLRTNAN